MKQVSSWQIVTAENMEAFGVWIATLFQSGDVVFLRGEMGSGKTTLVRGIARGLDYPGRVSSPTFTLMNIYETKLPIYHIDFYRIEADDVVDLGLDDLTGGVMLLEWPEIGADFVKEADFIIDISLTDEDYDLPRVLTLSVPMPQRFSSWKEGRDDFGY